MISVYLGPKLQITRTQPTQRVWNDAGSDGDMDGSFWTVPGWMGGYYLLGDTSCSFPNWMETPCDSIVLVKDNGDDLVREPIDSKKIWDDSGSGADSDVSIYGLYPPEGYKCLGMAAVGSYSAPDLEKYRCVKEDYVEQVPLQSLIYIDNGSGATNDFASYSIQVTKETFSMGLFFGVRNHDVGPTIDSTKVDTLIRNKTSDD